MRRILFLALGIGAMVTQGFSQARSAISGNVKDNAGKGLQAVTVSLLQSKDSSLVKSDVTDANGQYQFTVTKTGKFFLSYTIIGFEKNYSAAFELQNGQNYDAAAISLQPASKKLQDVTVTSRKPMIEIKADKTVF
ncbi:MAG: hypothetical protein RLZZ28_1349, partial [Bacteroidota bacterium]